MSDIWSLLKNANDALNLDANFNEALKIKALLLCDIDKHKDATALLGEISLNDPQNAFAMIMRGWILEKEMKQPAYAKNFYQRAIELEANNLMSLKGFAHLALGNNNEAIDWIEAIVANTQQHDGKEYYYATCIYAWVGDYDKALDYMAKALDKGYANYHDWTKTNDANINVSPIRNFPEFNELLHKYSITFDRQH